MELNIESLKKVFILGIKGVGMTQIAIILHKMGKTVVGVDVAEEFITDVELKKYPIEVIENFELTSLPGETDLVIYSAAHGGSENPIVKEAVKRGVVTMNQAAFLGKFIELFHKSIAVCGSHGKTTTSSLLSYALIKLGAKPSYMTGSSSFNNLPAGDFNSKEIVVIEADEYGVNPPGDLTPKFQFLYPSFTLCTNIDFDHPDIFKSIDEVIAAYKKFFEQSEYGIICADNEYAIETAKNSGIQFDSYGFTEESTVRIINHEVTGSGSKFDLLYGEKVIDNILTSLFGDHNILNTAGAFLLLLRLGYREDQIKQAIANFVGAKRRFEVVFEKNGWTLVDDYAHHPVEIKAVIKAATERYGTKPVVIFQPHTFSRTKELLEEFATAFSGAQHAYIMPIFASAREKEKSFTITHTDIVSKAKDRGFEAIEACSTKEDLISKLKEIVLPSVVMTLGAGDVYKLNSDIIREFNL